MAVNVGTLAEAIEALIRHTSSSTAEADKHVEEVKSIVGREFEDYFMASYTAMQQAVNKYSHAISKCNCFSLYYFDF